MPGKNWFDKAKTTMETAGSKVRAGVKAGARKAKVSAKVGGAIGAGTAVAKRVIDKRRGE